MVKEMGVPNILAKAQNEYHAVYWKNSAQTVSSIRTWHGDSQFPKNILDYIELSDEFSLVRVQSTLFQ